MGYADQARRFAEHNVADWRAVGAKWILVLDPHDYISFTEDYPGYFGAEYEFEIVLVVELVAELLREGKLELEADRPGRPTTTPRRLNKRKGIHEAPREILRDSGADLQGRRPRDAVVVLSGGGAGPPPSSGPT